MPSDATQQWLDKASEDEQVVLLIKNAGGPWGVAAYHIQQAAEKYIKAALVEAEVAPPKSHDLEQLLQMNSDHEPPDFVLQAAAMLSAYAWLTRYPGAPPIAESDVLSAETQLVTIKEWVLHSVA